MHITVKHHCKTCTIISTSNTIHPHFIINVNGRKFSLLVLKDEIVVLGPGLGIEAQVIGPVLDVLRRS